MFRGWRSLLFVALAAAIAAPLSSIGAKNPTSNENSRRQEGPASSSDAGTLVVAGKTYPAPGHISEIAATVMHPVTRVIVNPGDVVSQGQPLVELDADEPEAEVRAKAAEVRQLAASLAKLKSMPRAEERAEARAQLDSAQVEHKAARSLLERLTRLRESEAISARQFIDQQTSVLRLDADERAAQARLDYLVKLPLAHEIAETEAELAVAQAELQAAEAELEHYVIYASIDGIVCWLDVTPGTVSRAGTRIWGEIVDLREVDVRVELSSQQLAQLDLSGPILVEDTATGRTWPATFVFASPVASRETGSVPVTLRVADAEKALRCHLNVTVRFQQLAASQTKTAGDCPNFTSASE